MPNLQDQLAGLIELGYARLEELEYNLEKKVVIRADIVQDNVGATNDVKITSGHKEVELAEFLQILRLDYSFVLDLPLGAKLQIEIKKFEDFKTCGLDRFKELSLEIPTLYHDQAVVGQILEQLLQGLELLMDILVEPFQLLNAPYRGPRRETLALIASLRHACRAFDLATKRETTLGTGNVWTSYWTTVPREGEEDFIVGSEGNVKVYNPDSDELTRLFE